MLTCDIEWAPPLQLGPHRPVIKVCIPTMQGRAQCKDGANGRPHAQQLPICMLTVLLSLSQRAGGAQHSEDLQVISIAELEGE